MIFDRFIFILYLLFSYNWFLLGYEYESPVKYMPIVLMALSLAISGVIAIFQLQIVIKQKVVAPHERWGGMLWSMVHISICLLILSDALELANILVIGMISGLLLTGVIVTVGTCSCYVIMLNGVEWYSHLHLTCITFWILVQFMDVRLPSTEIHYTTSVAISSMAFLRGAEIYFHKIETPVLIELVLWITCVVLHIVYDTGGMDKITFFWGTSLTISALIIFNRYTFAAITIVSLPFITFPIILYFIVQCRRGTPFEQSFENLEKTYDSWMAEPETIPFEIDEIEEDWDSTL